MNIAQAKCIPLDRYLESQGHRPKSTRQGGRELWYHSPIRDDDANPSFKIDTIKNLWFDHGKATGGNIIDLVREMCACDVRDALQHLEKTGLYSPALSSPMTSMPRAASRRSEASPGKWDAEGEKEKSEPLRLISKGALQHPALLQYLTKRGINHEVARKYLSQITYNPPRSAGNYFGVGYPAGDGFEARNALFKGFVGTGKSVTYHEKPGSSRLFVFEGFMDFLSYLTFQGSSELDACAVVLNSTNLWRRALPYVQDARFEEVTLFLDNDSAGDAATRQLIEHSSAHKTQDGRSLYSGFEDCNAWLVARSS